MRRPKKKEYDYKKALRDTERQKKVVKKDLTPKDEVKEMFYSWFKRNRKADKVMTKQDVISNIITKLDKRKNQVLELAMDELKSSGFMELQSDGVSLVLTEKGREFIS